jgi:hypothetical protein
VTSRTLAGAPSTSSSLNRNRAIRSSHPPGAGRPDASILACAEPSKIEVAVPNMRVGDSVPLGNGTLRVVGVREDDADQPPVLALKTQTHNETADVADESCSR